MTTLRQGNQVLNLILQQETSREQLQKLFATGLLSDLLSGNLEGVNRNHFRKILGLRPICSDPSMERSVRQLEKEDPLDRYPWLGRKFHFTGIDLVVNDAVSGASGHQMRDGIKALEVCILEAATSEELREKACEAIKHHNMIDCEVLDECGDMIGGIGIGAVPKWDFNFEDAHFLVLSRFAGTELIVVYEIKKLSEAQRQTAEPISSGLSGETKLRDLLAGRYQINIRDERRTARIEFQPYAVDLRVRFLQGAPMYSMKGLLVANKWTILVIDNTDEPVESFLHAHLKFEKFD